MAVASSLSQSKVFWLNQLLLPFWRKKQAMMNSCVQSKTCKNRNQYFYSLFRRAGTWKPVLINTRAGEKIPMAGIFKTCYSGNPHYPHFFFDTRPGRQPTVCFQSDCSRTKGCCYSLTLQHQESFPQRAGLRNTGMLTSSITSLQKCLLRPTFNLDHKNGRKLQHQSNL